MKFYLTLSIFFCLSMRLISQTLSPTVIASCGGYTSNGGVSLSWTAGESFTTTLTSANNLLTQGFQQPEVKIILVNVTAFLQGYYTGSGTQNSTLSIVGISGDVTASDTIEVDLWNALNLANPLPDFSQKGILHSNGTVTLTYRNVNSGSYYIALKHRNSVETWSATPLNINSSTVTYNFASSQASAFDNNLADMHDGNFAIFTGDINQDGAVDGSDFLLLDPSIQNGDGGYAVGDLTGDGAVDGFDFLSIDPNIQIGIGAARP
jgi:hypothetical protein